MGTKGMRASLMSREVHRRFAPSSRCAAIRSTRVLFLVGCDKTIPAAAMAAARLDLPSVILYGGSIMPGHVRGKAITIQDVFEAVGAHSAGTIDDAELREVEVAACPGAGACGGQFTANTMALAMTFLGLSPMGLNDIPAVHPDKQEAAAEAGRILVEAVPRRPQRAQPDHPGEPAQRRRRRHRHGGLDQPRPPPPRHRPRGRDRREPTSTSTCSTTSRAPRR